MPLPHPQRLSRLQRLPRLRIAHQLSLLLTGAVMLAVLAVGSLTLWNLRSGFGEYTRQRDDEQLMRFVQLVERRASAARGMGWLTDDPGATRDLMDEFRAVDGDGSVPVHDASSDSIGVVESRSTSARRRMRAVIGSSAEE